MRHTMRLSPAHLHSLRNERQHGHARTVTRSAGAAGGAYPRIWRECRAALNTLGTIAPVFSRGMAYRSGDRREHQWLLMFLTLLLFLPAAQAQRGVSGPVYDRNVDELIPGAGDLLSSLEDAGWLFRGQATTIFQARSGFRSRDAGEGTFDARDGTVSTQSADLVIGRQLWDNAEIFVVPSLTRGFGLSDSRGIGAGLNGEAFHGGSATANLALTRLFLRQTIDLSYDAFGQDDDPMRFAGPLAQHRLTFSIGRLAVWDFFDNNRYAHDARTQFLSWALVGTGAFDPAGDASGFTNGAVLEWENGTWAIRSGLFQVVREAGGNRLDSRIGRAGQALLQLERQWWWGRHRGVARILTGASRTRSALWNTLAAAASDGFETQERGRNFRIKTMAAFNFEQAINDTVGVFLRLGWNDGRSQNWMFTDMDWSVSAGMAVNGGAWSRWNDTVGVGFNVGGLSPAHRRWREVGGSGFVVGGSSQFRYAPEAVFESYYDVDLAAGLNAALSFQFVVNPGYDMDRGPVPVAAFRLRAAF